MERLEAITRCMDELAKCRCSRSFGAALGELDWLSELHDLLYERMS